jgi:hypothetical protein
MAQTPRSRSHKIETQGSSSLIEAKPLHIQWASTHAYVHRPCMRRCDDGMHYCLTQLRKVNRCRINRVVACGLVTSRDLTTAGFTEGEGKK